MNSLDDEYIAAAHVFADADKDVSFAEDVCSTRHQRDAEIIRNRLSQHGIRRSGEQRQIPLRRLKWDGSWAGKFGTWRRRWHVGLRAEEIEPHDIGAGGELKPRLASLPAVGCQLPGMGVTLSPTRLEPLTTRQRITP